MKPNPEFLQRARAMYEEATERIKRLQAEIEEAGRERSLAIALLHDHGMSYSEIGRMVGLSPPRIGQLITGLRDEST